jgi:PPP family 3-phenylpropionic acid transporter
MRDAKNSLYIRFALIEILFFSIFAITSYQTVFLIEIGLTGSQIGILSSLGAVIGMAALPVWGMAGDRMRSAKIIFTICIAATSLMYVLFPVMGKAFQGNPLPFYFYVPLIYLFRQPANPLLDSWAVSSLAPRNISYGTVRRWGSLGFSVVSLLLSAVVGKYISTSAAFYCITFLILPLVFICLSAKGGEDDSGRKAERPGPQKLLGNYSLITYLIYTLGLNIYLAVTLIFMAYIMAYAGCSASLLGLVFGFRALMEIVSMSAAGRLRKRLPLSVIMIIPGILFGTEHLLYQYCNGIISLLAIMVLSGLAGGIFYSMGPSYVHEIVAPEVRNSAQALSGVIMSVTGIVGTLSGGCIIDAYGVQTLTTGCSVLIFLLTLGFIVSLKFKPKG